jgi:hypothetical protein
MTAWTKNLVVLQPGLVWSTLNKSFIVLEADIRFGTKSFSIIYFITNFQYLERLGLLPDGEVSAPTSISRWKTELSGLQPE